MSDLSRSKTNTLKQHTYKGFLFAFPIIGALLVAISRTEDYRHHWQDVTIGALLGTFCAYFAYRQYYPGLSQEACRDPFLTRVAYCKRGFGDVETGVLATGGTHNHGASNIALLSQTQANNNKYQVEDNYSDETASSSNNGQQDNLLFDHTNSRIPLVGRNA
jgi:hypothetical protein